MKEFIMVGLGGLIGSITRYGVYLYTSRLFIDKSHIATLIVNLVGCFLIGLLSGNILKGNNQLSLLLITGVCGGFTTFSAFALDGIKLLKNGLYSQFLLYSLLSVVGGLIFCLFGILVTNRAQV